MSGISLFSALEIFTQPDDLQFSIGEQAGKWGLAITRGPGHDYKLIITSQPVLESREAAANAIKTLLTDICTAATSELNKPKSMLAALANPDGLPIDDAHMLSGEYRERIFNDLMEHGVAQTFAYKKSKSA